MWPARGRPSPLYTASVAVWKPAAMPVGRREAAGEKKSPAEAGLPIAT